LEFKFLKKLKAQLTKITAQITYPDYSFYPDEDHLNWRDAETSTGFPTPKGKRQNDPYADAEHAHDLVIRRYITGILVMLNRTPVRRVYKRKMTVDKAYYV
jgi:hypothetical protein